MLLIFVLPLHTFITIRIGTHIKQVLLLSSWKEVFILSLSLIVGFLVFRDEKTRAAIYRPLYNKLAALYLLLSAIYVIFQRFDFSAIAGAAVNTRFILVFFCAQIIALYVKGIDIKLKNIVILIAFIVSIFGILQALFLDSTFLVNFGYDGPGINTPGVPPAVHYVAPDSDLIRAQATLRGPNIFGAFLLLPIVLQSLDLRKGRNWLSITRLLTMLMAFVLTYSRSAWIGLLLAGGVWITSSRYARIMIRKSIVPLSFSVLLFVGLTVMFVSPVRLSEVILHSNESVEGVQSNEGHIELSKKAAKEVIKDPLGDGLGSAGPVSAIEEQQQARIAENYYLQIGQEIGWTGMILFVVLQTTIMIALWKGRANDLHLALFLTAIAITVTNLFLHTWADEVVAITFWLFAGAALAPIKKVAKS
jgi:hypothetical protein